MVNIYVLEKEKQEDENIRTPKSILIVSTKDEICQKSARNLSGVDVVKPNEINIEHLAPGGDAGRLTIFTKSAT